MTLYNACRKSLTKKDYKKITKDYQRLPKIEMMTDAIIGCLQEKSYEGLQ